jgi:hypothetical protein
MKAGYDVSSQGLINLNVRDRLTQNRNVEIKRPSAA